ncbi:Sensor histidine kinase [Acidisarcina polymorpha]|uniref:histidine kinase n=1 Tax=Acidisarcina polymorpha TaxID=2211140 RepID=A0A2Z5G7N1_9BACT|nr:ATP-binding protein [Acidisarcina polymorpha]AXC14576.1 Sensor histidine kinase [Acidisarcina polymorpha]
MLSLYQRLVLGCFVLLVIVFGMTLFVRASLRRVAATDVMLSSADQATAMLTGLESALAREQLLAAEFEAEPGPTSVAPLMAQMQQTERQIKATALLVADPSLNAFQQQHSRLSTQVGHAVSPDQLRAMASSQLRLRLAALDQGLQQLMATQSAKQLAAQQTAIRERTLLSRHMLTVVEVSSLLALIVAPLIVYSVIAPLHEVAQSAQLIGKGDLQARIEWRSHDDLGIIATEVNRLAVRMRDLRETESGRRQMEHQLSDAVLQSIFEPIIVTDGKGQLLKLNQAAIELLGEVAGDRMALTNTPGGDKILKAVRDAVSMQRAITNEGEAALLPMRIGEAQRSYRLRTTPMRDEDGKLLGAVTVLEDVTQMQEVDRFKTRFISVASQKLRDPLQRIRLSLYTLSKGFGGELKPLQADLLQGAEEEAEALNDLMADLIEVAELDTGRRELKIERLRPLDILQDAHDRFIDEAQAKQIEIEIRAFSDLSHVNADRRALRSILDNLLSNAIRYTPPGGSILLRAEEIKDRVQFFVRDTGRGIETERLPMIFGRFDTSGGTGEGTGLGLALVRRLVESLGGQVAVESRLGSGTTFSFTVPMATVQASRHPVEVG